MRNRLIIFCSLCSLCSLTAAPVAAQSVILTVPRFRLVAAADEKLGSTMTLQELKGSQGKRLREQEPQIIKVQPAAEPTPALKHRLYPSNWDLKPGQALLHLHRAQILFSQHPREKQNLWQSGEWLEGTGDGAIPTSDEIRQAVDSLDNVYRELHLLARSEDFRWDHRLRDIRGPQVYMYLLPDIQEIRKMARMLVLKIRWQLSQDDFEGALSSISDGLRLAEFVGQGETLIQKLVGTAMTSMMRKSITDAISRPNCPNLYWALATIPQPLMDVSDSVLWELSNVPRVLPVLSEAEQETWTESEANSKWRAALDDLGVLSGSGLIDGEFRVALAISSVAFADSARKRLQASGFSMEQLGRMPALQIVLVDASRELRRIGDDLGKAYLLPTALSRPLIKRENERFQQWLRTNRLTSPAAAISGILYPSVVQAKEAEIRSVMAYNRLMTLEALRMHAAGHDGALPATLDQLDPVPAMPDPYTGEHFEYKVDVKGGAHIVELKADGPRNYKPLQTLRAKFSRPAPALP